MSKLICGAQYPRGRQYVKLSTRPTYTSCTHLPPLPPFLAPSLYHTKDQHIPMHEDIPRQWVKGAHQACLRMLHARSGRGADTGQQTADYSIASTGWMAKYYIRWLMRRCQVRAW